MSLKTLIMIMALFSLIWGTGFLLLPIQMWAMYGINLDITGVYMARELGSIFFMLGVILWFARNDTGSQSLQAIVLGLFVGNTIGFVVSLIGQLTAGINALGWVAVAAYFLLALGFGTHLLKPTKARVRARHVS
jgi:hypothetical protein